MDDFRNILTVDGQQVAILGIDRQIGKFEFVKIKKKFAEERNIPLGLSGYGIGLVFKKPKMKLDIWKPA